MDPSWSWKRLSQAMRLVTNIFAKHMGKEICGYAASFTEELGSTSIAIPCYGSWLSSEVLMYLIAGIMTGFYWKALTGMTTGYKSKSSGWMHPKWLHVAMSYSLDNCDHDLGRARNMIFRGQFPSSRPIYFFQHFVGASFLKVVPGLP